jgi:hypothetical protein
MEEEIIKKSETGCPECGNLYFRLEEMETDNRDLELYMIKCGYCNTVVGMYDKSISDLLYEIKALLTVD